MHKIQNILPLLQDKLDMTHSISFKVLNPDICDCCYAGTIINVNGIDYLYRSYKAWTDMAELLHAKMLTPRKIDENFIEITFKKLKKDSFHDVEKTSDKYGIDSHFSRIHKMEEPSFYYYYHQALDNVKIENKNRILNLGINRGDEFEVIKNKLNTKKYDLIDFVGVDHSESAIAYANKQFPEQNVKLYTTDINLLDTLNLGKFDLLISIGTLQSSSIHFKPFLMYLVQHYLEKDAALILGFPNSRWVGGEMIYGAKAPNYQMNEMSLLLNDISFAKKYLQQKKYRVSITGKQYLFLTATKFLTNPHNVSKV